MRVTQNLTQSQFLANLDTLQTNHAQTLNQISTNLSFSTPSQNPVAAGEVNGYTQALAQSTQYDTNATAAQTRLGTEDSAMSQVQSALQSLRDLALQANTGTLSASDRAAIATQATQIQGSLVSLANTQDGNGEYIFGGYATKTQPFTLNATGAQYNGDVGQRQVQIAAGQTIAEGDNGQVFNQIKTGNGTFTATASATNAGTGVLGATTVANPNAPSGGPFKIAFTAATTYQVTDASNNVVAGGAYAAPQTIAFSGMNVTLGGGAPKPGDSFAVTPAANGLVSIAANAANTGAANAGTGGYTGSNYNIAFTSANAYQVQRVNPGGGITVVSAGTYAAGQAITVGDEQVTLNGAPKGGDSFAVNPTTNANYTVAPAAGNTGTGYADTLGYSGGNYSIAFPNPSTSPLTYQVLDAGGTAVTSGAYTSGQAIIFAGAQVTLTGTPAAGDTFSVAPSANQSLFTTVQSLITALQAGSTSGTGLAQLNNSVNGAINNIDQALNQTSNVRSSIGGRLNAITTQLSVSSSQQIQLQSSISTLQSLDYASAITTLDAQNTTLSASMQAYTMTQGLSLFKYL